MLYAMHQKDQQKKAAREMMMKLATGQAKSKVRTIGS